MKAILFFIFLTLSSLTHAASYIVCEKSNSTIDEALEKLSYTLSKDSIRINLTYREGKYDVYRSFSIEADDFKSVSAPSTLKDHDGNILACVSILMED